MLISRKGKYFHVFGCISKNFPENIFWVWKRRRKTQIQKNTSHNPEKNHQQRQIQSDDRAVDRDLLPSSRDCDRRRDLVKARSRSTTRSREALIAILDLPLSPTYKISRSRIFLSRRRSRSRSGVISRRRDRDQRRNLATARSRSTLLLSCACALSLSLSHFLEML